MYVHFCNEAREVVGLDHIGLGKDFGFYLSQLRSYRKVLRRVACIPLDAL